MSGMLSSEYDYTPQMLAWMSTVLMSSIFVSQILLRSKIDKIGYLNCLALSQILAIISLGAIVYSKQYEIVLISQVIFGLAAALWGPSESAWIANNVNSDERARALSSYSSLRTLASVPAPFIGGILFDVYGSNIPILTTIALIIIDIGLILTLIKD